jgi:hypothetical protein
LRQRARRARARTIQLPEGGRELNRRFRAAEAFTDDALVNATLRLALPMKEIAAGPKRVRPKRSPAKKSA